MKITNKTSKEKKICRTNGSHLNHKLTLALTLTLTLHMPHICQDSSLNYKPNNFFGVLDASYPYILCIYMCMCIDEEVKGQPTPINSFGCSPYDTK